MTKNAWRLGGQEAWGLESLEARKPEPKNSFPALSLPSISAFQHCSLLAFQPQK